MSAILDPAILDSSLAIGAGAVAVAGMVRGLAGFGGALVMVPILGLLFGPAAAVTMVSAIELLGYAQLLPTSARHIRWKELGPMCGMALLALPVGVYLVVHVDPELMRRGIGAIVLTLALALLLDGIRGATRASRPRPGLGTAMGVSAVSGLLLGLAGTPGPPIALFLYAGPDSAAANRHQLIGYFTVTDAAALAMLIASGALDRMGLARLILLLPLSVLATWCGGRLAHSTNDTLLRRLTLVLIASIGLFGLAY